ncbi:MAG: hypothetical protein IPH79_09205 [Sphingomonadales bacterium]|nr:hypothetical protein [Sphingomonadales bacterium]
MAGKLALKFVKKDPLPFGAAYVVCNGEDITPDCATFAELDFQLRELEANIASIRKSAKTKFDRAEAKLLRNE